MGQFRKPACPGIAQHLYAGRLSTRNVPGLVIKIKAVLKVFCDVAALGPLSPSAANNIVYGNGLGCAAYRRAYFLKFCRINGRVLNEGNGRHRCFFYHPMRYKSAHCNIATRLLR